MASSPDVVIIGSGIGGGTLAYRLVQHGLTVTILERGGFLPQEPENWDVNAVFFDQKYVPEETWLDKEGTPFRPGTYYYVGGSSKLYGGAMLRLRERDFEALEHVDGVSPAWPISYRQLAPYYDLAEKLYLVHGQAGVDPTEPPDIPPYPYPALDHEPVIERVARALKQQGINAFPLLLAVQRHEGGPCVRCKTCDGFPCKVHAKTDAEVAAIKPALATGRLTLKTNSKATRLILTTDGRRVNAVEYEREGRIERITAPVIVLSASAVNSAVLLLRSACDKARQGIANSSGVVGRNYMAHNNTSLMSIGWKINNMAGHKRLTDKAVSLMKKIGFKLNIAKHMGGLSVSHQCGTVRFGSDPSKAALNEFCRSFDHDNLFVVDASFFPSSAAVNPALTIAAQAIRVADHMAKADFGVTGIGGSQ